VSKNVSQNLIKKPMLGALGAGCLLIHPKRLNMICTQFRTAQSNRFSNDTRLSLFHTFALSFMFFRWRLLQGAIDTPGKVSIVAARHDASNPGLTSERPRVRLALAA